MTSAPADLRVLMWFRADLRASDNTALLAAREHARRGVIACFTLCPDQWREHDRSGVQVDFVLRSLRVLSADLARLNIPLLLVTAPRFADVPAALLALAQRHDCDAVYYNKEYEVNELRRDQAVARAFEDADRFARGFTDQTLVEPGEVRTGEGRFFTVFSPFKRALYKILDREGVTPGPAVRRQDPIGVAPSEIPASVAGFSSHAPDAPNLWPAGEQHARSRLAAFVAERLTAYKAMRDLPAADSTSALSPYLVIGAVSMRQAMRAAMDANQSRLDSGGEGAVHWISELAWREFYKHILIGFPRVCMGRAFKPETERIEWTHDDALFDAWCRGQTGVPIVDAGMRQLLATGWMHNRLRMVTAMYLTKDLFIDWRRGERFFMQHLIDGDLAPNNGGWQWSASTGTDAAPYFRIFNPVSQSRRCDPDGAFIRRFVPELAELEGGENSPIHDPETLPGLLRSRLNYPRPIVDHAAARDRVLAAFKAL
jgi:deoxyribodipyrimidine photo-lyase